MSVSVFGRQRGMTECVREAGRKSPRTWVLGGTKGLLSHHDRLLLHHHLHHHHVPISVRIVQQILLMVPWSRHKATFVLPFRCVNRDDLCHNCPPFKTNNVLFMDTLLDFVSYILHNLALMIVTNKNNGRVLAAFVASLSLGGSRIMETKEEPNGGFVVSAGVVEFQPTHFCISRFTGRYLLIRDGMCIHRAVGVVGRS